MTLDSTPAFMASPYPLGGMQANAGGLSIIAHGMIDKRDRRAGLPAARNRHEHLHVLDLCIRDDLVAKEEAEISIIGEYLPDALTEEQIGALITEGISATGASSARDMGKVMGWLAPWTRGRADGKHVSELVVQALAEADLAAHDVGTH